MTFLLGIIGRNKVGISLCLFFLPYNLFSIKGLGFNLFAIMGFESGYILRSVITHKSIWQNLYYKSYFRLILLSFSLSIFIVFVRQDYSDVSGFGLISVKSTSIIFISVYISCLLLYVIIYSTTKSLSELLTFITAFIVSSYYIFLSWVGSFIYNFGLPDFLQMRHSGGGYERFSGFWGDYELTNEYFFIVLILSIITLSNKDSKRSQKILSLGAIIISLPLAVSTGTRSFLVMIALFIIISFILLIFRKNISIARKMSLTFASIIIMIITYFLVSRSYIFSKRFEQTLILAQSGSRNIYIFEKIVNRSYSDTYQDILEVGGLFGIGPVFVHNVRGLDMVYHCLYYSLVINFGIIGLIIYLAFFKKLLKDLYINYKSKSNILYLMLFSLLLSLLVDEIKINFMRQASQILIYWFLFAIIAVVNNGFHFSKSNKDNNVH